MIVAVMDLTGKTTIINARFKMYITFSKQTDPEMDELFPFPYKFGSVGKLKLIGTELSCTLDFPSLLNPKLIGIRGDGTIIFKGSIPHTSGTGDPIEEGYYFVSDSPY